jgi:hypothetical protein
MGARTTGRPGERNRVMVTTSRATFDTSVLDAAELDPVRCGEFIGQARRSRNVVPANDVRAEHLIGHGATVQAAARAIIFDDARMLRRLRTRVG